MVRYIHNQTASFGKEVADRMTLAIAKGDRLKINNDSVQLIAGKIDRLNLKPSTTSFDLESSFENEEKLKQFKVVSALPTQK